MASNQKRPWFHLHFLPWILCTFALSGFVFAMVSWDTLLSNLSKVQAGLFVGAGLLFLAAKLEERDENREDAKSDSDSITP